MEKLLIEVSLPAADLVYDLFVPDSMQVGTLTELTASVFAKISEGDYLPLNHKVLCEKTTGKTYNDNDRIRDTDIRNGTKLILY